MDIQLIGAAIGLGAQNPASALGPDYLYRHHFLEALQSSFPIHWKEIINIKEEGSKTDKIIDLLTRLERSVYHTMKDKSFPLVLGGDHSCAIGTWSGVVNGLSLKNNNAECGLLWVDAHLDAHTQFTSPSQAIHGMPLATLLGYADNSLLTIGGPFHRFKPENVVVIGARSWESGERELLEFLDVNIIGMAEIRRNGLTASLQKAHQIITSNTTHFGVSIDLDVFDPDIAPAVCSKEHSGLEKEEFFIALKHTQLFQDSRLAALEIVEFAPEEDIDNKTFQIIIDLIKSFVQ